MNKVSNTTISFNATSDVKNRLQKIANNYGITVSDLMRMSATQVINKGISIEPSMEPSDYLLSTIKNAEKDLESGNTTSISRSESLSDHLAGLRR